MSFNDLFAEYYSVLEALRRCADRLRFMLDIIFPHCVLHVIDGKSYNDIDTHIMAEAFHEYHCHKLLEEYRLECDILQQLTLIEGIHRLFESRKLVNRDDIKYYDNDWNIMDESSDNAFFILEMFVNPDISLPGLYAINTQVWELTSGEKDYLLSSLTTKKYFPIHAEVGDD